MLQRDLQSMSIASDQWRIMREQAEMLVKTGFLPSAVTTAEKAIAIMMKGRELGLPPMYALSNIAVISGKPTAGAEVLQALIYRDHGDNALVFVETNDTQCTISYRRRQWVTAQTYSYSIDDAKRAGLTSQTWQKYPAAMLRARCISAVARMAFADTIGGMYTPEELGAEVAIDAESGEILVKEPPAPCVQAPSRPRPSAAITVVNSNQGVPFSTPVNDTDGIDESEYKKRILEVSGGKYPKQVAQEMNVPSLSDAVTAAWPESTGYSAEKRMALAVRLVEDYYGSLSADTLAQYA